jgi:hypothetical protein
MLSHRTDKSVRMLWRTLSISKSATAQSTVCCKVRLFSAAFKSQISFLHIHPLSFQRMASTQNGVHTPLVSVERTTYSGNSLTRDPVSQVDPEIWDLIKKVCSFMM